MFIYSFPLKTSLSTKKVFLPFAPPLSLPWNPIVGDAFTFSGDNELIAGEVVRVALVSLVSSVPSSHSSFSGPRKIHLASSQKLNESENYKRFRFILNFLFTSLSLSLSRSVARLHSVDFNRIHFLVGNTVAGDVEG
ncbi:hypothetical protein VNO80_24705 [Phaseolus coccineus]|uniref:Uncharacterized protein n=1 Tax=Phaseolus coccineus TaxID=3886 RepID=A0AAN9QPF2_PHACN